MSRNPGPWALPTTACERRWPLESPAGHSSSPHSYSESGRNTPSAVLRGVIGAGTLIAFCKRNVMDLEQRQTAIVVAERGSAWRRWVERFRVGTPDVVVFAQRDDEGLLDLALRIRSDVQALQAEGISLSRAVIAGSDRVDPEAISARALTVKALVAPMVADGEGTVILDGTGSGAMGMAALATTVAAQVQGTGVLVTSPALDAIANVA